MRVLITAGPTREHIDDIRFITNAASGIMGFALAQEATRRGHEVAIVLGPTPVTPTYGVKTIPAVSSDDMTEKALRELSLGYDVLISAAAIGDFTPAVRVKGKISSKSELTIRLKPTRKLIREARERFPKLRIVAFKAEYAAGSDEELLSAARALLPYAELVVANDVSRGIFGSDETEAFLVSEGGVQRMSRRSKTDAAKCILDALGDLGRRGA